MHHTFLEEIYSLGIQSRVTSKDLLPSGNWLPQVIHGDSLNLWLKQRLRPHCFDTPCYHFSFLIFDSNYAPRPHCTDIHRKKAVIQGTGWMYQQLSHGFCRHSMPGELGWHLKGEWCCHLGDCCLPTWPGCQTGSFGCSGWNSPAEQRHSWADVWFFWRSGQPSLITIFRHLFLFLYRSFFGCSLCLPEVVFCRIFLTLIINTSIFLCPLISTYQPLGTTKLLEIRKTCKLTFSMCDVFILCLLHNSQNNTKKNEEESSTPAQSPFVH